MALFAEYGMECIFGLRVGPGCGNCQMSFRKGRHLDIDMVKRREGRFLFHQVIGFTVAGGLIGGLVGASKETYERVPTRVTPQVSYRPQGFQVALSIRF